MMKWEKLLASRNSWVSLKSPRSLGRFILDNNCFIDLTKDVEIMLRLVEERAAGYVELVKTDLVDIELTEEYNKRVGDSFEVSIGFVEVAGVFVLDDSRLGHAVLGDDADGALIDDVTRLLKPGTNSPKLNDRRDARHVATAIRNSCTAFVTSDTKILTRATEIAKRWNLRVVDPIEALAIVQLHKQQLAQRAGITNPQEETISGIPPLQP